MINIFSKATEKYKFFILHILKYKIFRMIPDSLFLKLIYRTRFNRKLDLKNPKTLNEKLQWLKLYDRRPEYIQMVDKFAVKKYIAETIGEEYVIPLLGVYNSYREIDFGTLPNQFVLKPNHTSGNIFICKDKTKIDYSKLEKFVNMWLKRQYYWEYREWPYKKVKPRVICEKYLVDESGIDLKDYKFMCFNGEVKCCLVCSGRTMPGGLKIDFYDMNWEPMPLEYALPKSSAIIPKPKYFNKMADIAHKLSKDYSFVRIDLYEINDQLYFGELTLYPGSGYGKFVPDYYDYLLGSWINLSCKRLEK